MPEPARWRIVDAPRCKVQFQFEPRDLWVGLFWRVNRHPFFSTLHLYICVVPTVPLHISILRHSELGGSMKPPISAQPQEPTYLVTQIDPNGNGGGEQEWLERDLRRSLKLPAGDDLPAEGSGRDMYQAEWGRWGWMLRWRRAEASDA